MFSFIKWFGSLIENAKKKKGLWFTLLSVFSLIGIFLSLYFVNFLVSDVAKKTYENQKEQFELHLKSQFITNKERSLAIATVATQNEQLKELFVSDDEDASKNIKKSAKKLEEVVSKTLDSQNFSISFEQNDKFSQIKIVNGLDVADNGAFFKAVVPFVKTETAVNNIVVKESIKSLVPIFKNEKKEFVFMLNESSINKIKSDIKKTKYIQIQEKYFVKIRDYNNNFVESIKSIDLNLLTTDGYLKDKNYFYVIQKVFDVDGDNIGVAIIAESMSSKNSFVHLVKNLVNSVTTVALGLIVSMVLFLF